MSARFLPFPPIVGIFPHGRYRGLVGTLVAWRNGGRVLVRFDHDQRVREVWRRDMTLFDWRPHRPMLVKRCSAPLPPINRHDDGGMNPMAA